MKKLITPNEGTTDRIIRAVVGFAALGGAMMTSGILQIVLGVVAVAGLGTAILGYCGLYTLLGISTCPMKKK